MSDDLKVPKYKMFWKLGFVIKFHGFSEDVKHANPGVEIDHETMVHLWSRKIHELWPKWQTKKELDERKRYLAMALFRAAVNGNDDEKYKVEFAEQGEGPGVMFGRDEEEFFNGNIFDIEFAGLIEDTDVNANMLPGPSVVPQLASDFRVGEEDLSDSLISDCEEDAVAFAKASQKFEVEKMKPMDDPGEEAERQIMLGLFKEVKKTNDNLSSGLAALNLVDEGSASSGVRAKGKGAKRGADDMEVEARSDGEVRERSKKAKVSKKH